MANFDTPYYLDNFEKQFRFSEYEDNENYFLRLIYLIRRTEYAKYATPHGAYPALDVNITAHNGKKIFRDAYDVFDGGKSFKLLSESARDRAPNDLPHVIQVEQIYGYAPSITHVRTEEVDWMQPGIVDSTTEYESALDYSGPSSLTYYENLGQWELNMPANTFDVGDVVRLESRASFIGGGNNTSFLYSPISRVIAKTGNNLTIVAGTSTREQFSPQTGQTTISTLTPMQAAMPIDAPAAVMHNYNYFVWTGGTRRRIGAESGFAKLVRVSIGRPAIGLSVGATVSRSYFYASDGPPTQHPQFFVMANDGSFTDTVGSDTIPQTSEYKDMVAAGETIRPRSEAIGRVLGDVWFKDSYWIRAQ